MTWTHPNTRAAAGTARRIDGRLGKRTELGSERNRRHLTCFAAYPTLHPLQRKTPRANLRYMRKRRAALAAIERARQTGHDTFAAKAARRLVELRRRIAFRVQRKQTDRARAHAIAATRAALQEGLRITGPRWQVALCGGRVSSPKKSASCWIHAPPLCAGLGTRISVAALMRVNAGDLALTNQVVIVRCKMAGQACLSRRARSDTRIR